MKLASIVGWKAWPKKMGPALVIPFRHSDGTVNGYARLKPTSPKKDRNGKPRKYESPKGQRNRPYFPPGVIDKLSDAGVPLCITEGEKKAAKADQEGIACIGLVGVFSFNTKGRAELCAELRDIAWNGRDVRICYDSDLNTNENVREAERRLAAALQQLGARVEVDPPA